MAEGGRSLGKVSWLVPRECDHCLSLTTGDGTASGHATTLPLHLQNTQGGSEQEDGRPGGRPPGKGGDLECLE